MGHLSEHYRLFKDLSEHCQKSTRRGLFDEGAIAPEEFRSFINTDKSLLQPVCEEQQAHRTSPCSVR